MKAAHSGVKQCALTPEDTKFVSREGPPNFTLGLDMGVCSLENAALILDFSPTTNLNSPGTSTFFGCLEEV